MRNNIFDRIRDTLREEKRHLTRRCEHCKHSFRRKRDPRFSFGGNSPRVYHDSCMGYIQWRRTAEERLEVLERVLTYSGMEQQDIDFLVSVNIDPEDEQTRVRNMVWRAFYDINKKNLNV